MCVLGLSGERIGVSRIDRIISESAPHERAAINAYQAALNKRYDWHMAVKEAVRAALAELKIEPPKEGMGE